MFCSTQTYRLACGLAAAFVVATSAQLVLAATGELELSVVDHDTGQPIAVRMHLKDQRGRSRRVRRLPFWRDHFVFHGTTVLKLPTGTYSFEMERGLEYKIRSGHFTIERGAEDNKLVHMQRFVHMKEDDWWSGDLFVQRPLREMELLMLADDLHVTGVVTWDNQRNLWNKRGIPKNLIEQFDGDRYYHLMAGRFATGGAEFLCMNRPRPFDRNEPGGDSSPLGTMLALAADDSNVHRDAASVCWDLPVLVAHGAVDSVGLAHSLLRRDGAESSRESAWCRPPDPQKYTGPFGLGQWSTEIYYHLLNCGLRLPPSAGSGSGVHANPVGYNRVYVHIDGEFNYQSWWKSLRAGRVVVTNGPLMRVTVEGRAPGHVFRTNGPDELSLEMDLALSTREKIEYLEIVRDGDVVQVVRLDEWAAAGGRLPPMVFRESGWFLLRAVTSRSDTYRFASTGPYYVQFADRSRISKSSARFFLDWVHVRARWIKKEGDESAKSSLSLYHTAHDFWQGVFESATAD